MGKIKPITAQTGSEAIVQKENPILRGIAEEEPIEEIQSRKTETIVRRMQKALEAEEDGIAIAAPQIGESLRIFVVSKKVFELTAQEDDNKVSLKYQTEGAPETLPKKKKTYKDLVFINPEILKSSKEQMVAEEGCLSVRWLYGQVKRSKKVLIKAYDMQGKPFTFGGSGLMAQIFQHEIDHLNGILFIYKARGFKEIPPNKTNRE